MPIRATKTLAIPSSTAARRKPKPRGKAKPNAKTRKPKGGKPKKGAGLSAAMAAAAAVAELAPLFRQEQSNWCWAGCAQMIAGSNPIGISPVPSQSEIVMNQLGTLVNQTQNENQIVSLYNSGKVGGVPIRCVAVSSILPQEQLDEQLEGGVPVQMGLVIDGGKHVSLVVGIEDAGNDPFYIVHDPALGRGRFSFQGLLTAYGRGQWFMTFGGFARA